MGIFRSEDMQLYQLIMQSEDAWATINELGKLDCLHFIDLNKDKLAYEQLFAKIIKSIEETERKINLIEQECTRHQIDMPEPKNVTELQGIIEKLCQGRNEMLLRQEIESDVNEKEKFISNTIKQIKELHKSFNTQVVVKSILNKAQSLAQAATMDSSINNEDGASDDEGDEQSLLKNDKDKQGGHNDRSHLPQPLVGSISASEQMRLKKLIFRTSRGKAFVQIFELDEKIYDYYGNQQDTCIYFLYHPQDSKFLRDRLKKVCDSFHGESYDLPRTKNEISEQLNKTKVYLDNLYSTLKLTIDNFKKYLVQIQHSKQSEGHSLIKVYKQYLRKDLSIYNTMNKLKSDKSLLVGLFWVPNQFSSGVYDQIRKGGRVRIAQIYEIKQHSLTPPTHYDLNEFMWPYHEIVATYGIPNYKEANPTTFNMITFPFLFGVMFGDIGHGSLLFAFAIYLCWKNDYLAENVPSMKLFLKIRYLLLLMGFFAVYCGFIYNDMMSMPLDLFGSCYTTSTEDYSTVTRTSNCVYPFGLDPKWYVASNEITFFNSFKMKLAVIIGVTQMAVGIFLKGLNALYNNSAVDYYFEYVPQMIFLMCIFGYMDVLIIVKWCTDWTGREGDAPSIITQMINNILHLGMIDGTALIVSDTFQKYLSLSLLAIAIICVPLMLFVKPIYLSRKYSQEHKELHNQSHEKLREEHDDFDNLEEDDKKKLLKQKTEELDWQKQILEDPNKGHGHNMSELFIHQLIETIEFVLGTVSNTASYLRLWALSLAHGELSGVFFEKTIGVALSNNSIIMFVLAFFVFATATFGVLMFMDVLECFLHDLRLHWVEFQNKFYKGQGYKFAPISHQKTLYSEE